MTTSWSRRVVFLLVGGSLIAFGAAANAQTTPPAIAPAIPPAIAPAIPPAIAPAIPPAITVSPDFTAQLDRLEPDLRNVEQNFAVRAARVNATKTITEADTVDLGESAALEAYANGLKAAFDDALQDAERAGRTDGREGSVAKFQKFEQVTKSQQTRLARLQAQASGIESQIRSGSIQLDRALLQRATPQERVEFQNALTPSGRNLIQEIHPNLFPRTSLDFPKYAGLVIPAIPLPSQSATNSEKSRAERCMNLIANLIVTPAEAAIAVPCVASCLAQSWPTCVSCVVAAGPVAVADYNAMVSCWNGSGKPWWLPSWAWKIKCVAVLAGQLA